MDTFVMLEELLEQDQFELLPSKECDTERRLVYLMNDAVESFLVFRGAALTGHYLEDYEGALTWSISRDATRYVLVVRQGDNAVTLLFEKLDLEVEHVKFFKQFVIVKFKEFDNINNIERYKRCPLLVTRENAVPLEEDEYFVADMIGMKVITEDGTEFGTLSDVMETGANDVYVIDSKEHGEVLMPAIKECVLNVDMESGIITVHLMSGLI